MLTVAEKNIPGVNGSSVEDLEMYIVPALYIWVNFFLEHGFFKNKNSWFRFAVDKKFNLYFILPMVPIFIRVVSTGFHLLCILKQTAGINCRRKAINTAVGKTNSDKQLYVHSNKQDLFQLYNSAIPMLISRGKNSALRFLCQILLTEKFFTEWWIDCIN